MSLNQNLQLYLPLWSAGMQGTALTSKDKNQISCSVTGATWGNTGRTFSVSSDIITVPISNALKASGAFSLVSWVKVTTFDNGFADIFDTVNGYNDFANRLMVRESDLAPLAQIYFNSGSGQNVFGPSTTANAFNHIVYVYDASNEYIYTNKVKGTLYTKTGTPDTGNNNIILGRSGATYSLGGILGEAEFYNRALSSTEVIDNYNLTSPNYGSGTQRFGIIGAPKWGFFSWA